MSDITEHPAQAEARDMRSIAERRYRQITALRAQVAELTRERNELKSMIQRQGEINQNWIARCNELSAQAAALAEQNAKMREALSDASQVACFEGADYYLLPHELRDAALALPDIATPALNRLKAEGLREASEKIREGIKGTPLHQKITWGEYYADWLFWCAAELAAGQ